MARSNSPIHPGNVGLKEQGDWHAAEAAYRVAIERDGKTADQYLQLGHVLKLQNRSIEALNAYSRALELDPQLAPARFELAALNDQPSTEQRPPPPVEPTPPSAVSSVAISSTSAVEISDNQPNVDILDRSFCIVQLNTTRVIGWAYLPFDLHHTPLINVFKQGVLIAAGLANRTRPVDWLIGPKHNWFEISWQQWGIPPTESELAQLVFQRGEDGILSTNPLTDRRTRSQKVADLLNADAFAGREKGQPVTSQTTNFSAFAIVHIYFLDYLGRPADSHGLDVYQRSLEMGRMSVDDLRTSLLQSDEFRKRRVLVSDQLGQTACIRFLSLYPEVAYDRSPPLQTYHPITATALAAKDDAEFLHRCQKIFIKNRDVEECLPGLQIGRISRFDVLREMVLDAASTGRLVRIDDLTALCDDRKLADDE